ncbi:hypothetical protein ACJW31_03G076500 [Castanea mollissima]
MALSSLLQTQKIHSLLLNQLFIIIFFLLSLPHANSVYFNLSSFQPEGLQLTKNTQTALLSYSAGRALYSEQVRLWDNNTGWLADFTTHFSFIIKAITAVPADGLTFFIAPFGSKMPNNSTGGAFGLLNSDDALNGTHNQIVAVEFDTFKNQYDPSSDHVGIDVNSVVSKANVTWNSSISDGSIANTWINYNSTTKILSVFLTYADNPVFSGNFSLSYIVDLRIVLPEWVSVGLSAATGAYTETNTILSWSFNSTSELVDGVSQTNNTGTGANVNTKNWNMKNKLALIIGLAVSFGGVSCALGLLWFICWRKGANVNTEDFADDVCIDDEFEKGTGPRSFTYHELILYKGLLRESNTEVAVKRVSKGSRQGKKEYTSEVKTISHLRHRNLVQLIGWCHEQGELLLVYEFMANGSLDTHLFGAKIMLAWSVRYKIALGLASALLYLHEEWKQCVVHRDIKSSNIMLDSDFNAKLGDFGLARLVDHELGSQTTVLAGTLGYLAPECAITGKASKESDVYSFGVVSLEITCGRKPIQLQAEPSKVSLVEWVWDLYGKHQLLEAVDKRLSMEFDEKQTECLMVVGLWCCHPDPTIRPSIRQVINVLNFETPFPVLSSKLPVPMYDEPSMHMCRLSYTPASHLGSIKGQPLCSCSSCSTNSSTSVGLSKPLLNSGIADVELTSVSY